MINHDIIRIFNGVTNFSFPCDIVINLDIIRIFNEVSSLIDIKKRSAHEIVYRRILILS